MRNETTWKAKLPCEKVLHSLWFIDVETVDEVPALAIAKTHQLVAVAASSSQRRRLEPIPLACDLVNANNWQARHHFDIWGHCRLLEIKLVWTPAGRVCRWNIQGTAFTLSCTQRKTNLWKENPLQRLVRRNIVLDLPLSFSQIFYSIWDFTVQLLCFLNYCTDRAQMQHRSQNFQFFFKNFANHLDFQSGFHTTHLRLCTANKPFNKTLDKMFQ